MQSNLFDTAEAAGDFANEMSVLLRPVEVTIAGVAEVTEQTAERAVTAISGWASSISQLALPNELKTLAAESNRLGLAINQLKIDLSYAEPMSERAAAIERDIRILEAWNQKVHAQVTTLNLEKAAIEASRTALDGFNVSLANTDRTAALVREYGATGGGLIASLLGGANDAATGATMAGNLTRLIEEATKAGVAGIAEMGPALRAAAAVALANLGDPASVQPFLDLLADLQTKTTASTALTAANVLTNLDVTAGLRDLGTRLGAAGATLWTTFDTAARTGIAPTVATVATQSQAILDSLKSIPAAIAGPLKESFRLALEAYLLTPTVETAAALQGVMGDIQTTLTAGSRLTGDNLIHNLDISDRLAALSQRYGASGAALFSAFDEAARMGTEASLTTVTSATQGILKSLDALPTQMQGPLRERMIAATRAMIDDPSEASRVRVESVVNDIAVQTALILKNFETLAPFVQTAIQNLVIAVESGEVPLADAVVRQKGIIGLIPQNFADLPTLAQAPIQGLVAGVESGNLPLQAAVDRQKAVLSIIPKNFDELPGFAQEAFAKIAIAVENGSVPIKAGLDRVAQLTAVLPKSFKDIPVVVADSIRKTADAIAAGTGPIGVSVGEWQSLLSSLPKNLADLGPAVASSLATIIDQIREGVLSMADGIAQMTEQVERARTAAQAASRPVASSAPPPAQSGSGEYRNYGSNETVDSRFRVTQNTNVAGVRGLNSMTGTWDGRQIWQTNGGSDPTAARVVQAGQTAADGIHRNLDSISRLSSAAQATIIGEYNREIDRLHQLQYEEEQAQIGRNLSGRALGLIALADGGGSLPKGGIRLPSGGYITTGPMPALIGEDGPEIVLPLTKNRPFWELLKHLEDQGLVPERPAGFGDSKGAGPQGTSAASFKMANGGAASMPGSPYFSNGGGGSAAAERPGSGNTIVFPVTVSDSSASTDAIERAMARAIFKAKLKDGASAAQGVW